MHIHLNSAVSGQNKNKEKPIAATEETSIPAWKSRLKLIRLDSH